MKILIVGIGGKMGRIVYGQLLAKGSDEPMGMDKFVDPKEFSCPVYGDCAEIASAPDCIIDFSVRAAIYDYLPYAVENKIPCVIATTGQTDEDNEYIAQAAKKIPVFKSGNMSVGINLLIKLVKSACEFLGDKADIEIVETHHRRKADAPSGTALMLAKAAQSVATDTNIVTGRGFGSGKRQPKEIGISAVRGGTVAGVHEVKFLLDNEVITLSHNAEDRTIFADGSIDAAHYIVKQKPGLYENTD